MADEEENDLGLGLGGLFKGIEKLIKMASDLKEGEVKSTRGETDLGHIKKGTKGVFGFSVNTLVGKKPYVETFGNIKRTPKGPVIEKERKPITDLFDEEDEIKIYVEMPGANEEDIKIDLKGELLDISVQSGDRKYHEEFLLPARVKPETLTSNYKNGILEIRMEKWKAAS